MKLKVHESVYERLAHPQHSDEPSQAQLTTALNNLLLQALDQEEDGGS